MELLTSAQEPGSGSKEMAQIKAPAAIPRPPAVALALTSVLLSARRLVGADTVFACAAHASLGILCVRPCQTAKVLPAKAMQQGPELFRHRRCPGGAAEAVTSSTVQPTWARPEATSRRRCNKCLKFMTICSWHSLYGLLNKYFCRIFANGIFDCRLFADGVFAYFCRFFAEYLQSFLHVCF